MTETRRQSLGKGLSALLGEDSEDYARLDQVRTSKEVPIESLRPSSFQPRRRMSEEGIDDLARSIAEKGILQPILVRRLPDDRSAYEIIAGERRWRAAQKAALHEVPILIKDLSDREALEIALVENLQRQDLSALEEAEGYRRLMEEFNHTQEELAQSVSKSRSHVANMLRLLNLPDPVKVLLENGELSAGHARALLTADDPVALARMVAKRGLNVRQTERLVKAPQDKAPKPKAKSGKDPDTAALERDLTTLLGLTVEIAFKGGRGTLTLHYRTLDQLDDILHRLSHGAGTGGVRSADETAATSLAGESDIDATPFADAPDDAMSADSDDVPPAKEHADGELAADREDTAIDAMTDNEDESLASDDGPESGDRSEPGDGSEDEGDDDAADRTPSAAAG